MDTGNEASSKRPLLEEDSGSPTRVQIGGQRASQDPGQERYALLQGDAAEPGSPGHVKSAEHSGGVLQLLHTEEEQADRLQSDRRHADDAKRRPNESSDRREAEAVSVEMQSLAEVDHSREPLPVVSAASSNAVRQGDDRNCFICLQDGDKDNPLVSCCSTCYARTHRRCWREWRNNQHRSALRSHLLGLRMQTNHMLRCTICKSGTAMVEGEENGLSWMNELMCGGEPSENSLLGRLIALGNRRDDSDEDPEAQLEDLIDTRTCVALVIYLGVLIVAIVVSCVLIVTRGFWAGDVVLCCIIALYELSVLQLVLLAILRRRDTTLAATATRPSAEEPAAREIQLQNFSDAGRQQPAG
mmetsp:Transcript_192/g.461  ORF Transcript_192/g.461 Transcript_192/m.461 type:complete len:357 (+) Transcript_192:37-1107(+)